ncbi:MAG: thioredoxin family protein [Candidatus Bipolaricaulaceae bacterium]
MNIEVLGTGCPKCRATVRNAEAAIRELGIEADIVKVEDLGEISSRGVMLTPALAIDGEVVVSGRVPSAEEVKGYLAGRAR